MRYTDKTHFFRDDDDNRIAVVTTMLSKDHYMACVIEGVEAEIVVRITCGLGWSRFSAIADLNEKIEKARADV